MSYCPEVIADSSGWSRNALRFATYAEAHAWALDLMNRWFLVREIRVTESTDAVNYTYHDRDLKSIV